MTGTKDLMRHGIWGIVFKGSILEKELQRKLL
jgi:hypothetical protein